MKYLHLIHKRQRKIWKCDTSDLFGGADAEFHIMNSRIYFNYFNYQISSIRLSLDGTVILRSGALPTSPLEGEVLIGELQPGQEEIGMGGEKKRHGCGWKRLEKTATLENDLKLHLACRFKFENHHLNFHLFHHRTFIVDDFWPTVRGTPQSVHLSQKASFVSKIQQEQKTPTSTQSTKCAKTYITVYQFMVDLEDSGAMKNHLSHTSDPPSGKRVLNSWFGKTTELWLRLAQHSIQTIFITE